MPREVFGSDFAFLSRADILTYEEIDRLAGLCPSGFNSRLSLFLKFAPELGRREVPDPYYGGEDGFDVVLNLIEAASEGLLAEIRVRYL